jgi:tetratricopeptide (TPR) repeat protein
MAGSGDRPGRPAEGEDLAAALAHHRAGRLDQSEALYRRVLAQRPGHADALHLLGLVTLSRGDWRQAIDLIGQALVAAPRFAQGHSNLGNALRAAGRLEEAAASHRRAIALQPGFAAAHSNLGVVLGELGQAAAALASCRRAVELEPDSAEAGTNLGNLLFAGQAFPEAAECFRRAVERAPGLAAARRGLAASLRAIGRIDEAIGEYRALIAANAEDAGLSNDLGRCYLALGRFDEAVAAFRRALKIDPDCADAYRNLANCRSLAADGPETAAIAALAARADLSAEARAAAGFALGKALDNAGRYDAAFAAYADANRRYRDERAAQGDLFDATDLTRTIDRLIGGFTPEFFGERRSWGNPTALPVFVIGLPRSGTSLVEQIAASHRHVFGAGELKTIGTAAVELGPIDRPWTEAAVRLIAAAQLARLTALGGDARRVVDKLPDNIFQLGVIATLFPNARLIFCRRDPRDIGLSCYFQKFAAGALTFSYDLADCGRRIRETERLAAHWRRVLPLPWIEIEYERLIAEPETESRRLIDFLGLDWDPACLDFHLTERVIQTASAWQVRQALYGRSVGRWRHYQRHLGPLLAALDLKE